MNTKQLRILFIDDEDLPIIQAFRDEHYDVQHWKDVESLEALVDGRFQVVFVDVRGVGHKYGGTGLNLVQHISRHNPLIYTIVFSAKPFTGQESDLIRKHADRCIMKDCTFYELTDELEQYAKGLTPAFVIARLENVVKLNWWQRFLIKRGKPLSDRSLDKLAKRTQFAGDALAIVKNSTAIAAALIALMA
jgi:DNA-binding NarL/FixJ family response regulator